MLSFWIPALVLIALFVAFLLFPLLRQSVTADDDRRAVNLALYRQRLAELEADIVEPEDRAVLVEELKRELLVNADGDEPRRPLEDKTNRLPFILAGVLPVVAVLMFSDLGFSTGAVSDVVVSDELSSISMTDVAGLRKAARVLSGSLLNEPDNDQGWYLLGQTYMGLQDYAGAKDAFGRLKEKYPSEATIASYYAEAAYLANDRKMTPAINVAVEDALALNPHDVSMLEVKGMEAFAAGDLVNAREFFSRVLPLVQGERGQLIRQVIARIDLTTGAAPEAAPTGRMIHVQVELGERVPLEYNWSVFVFARAANGPPMPLAVQRSTTDELPATFVLTEEMAMIPGMGLANFDDVVVVARTSSAGVANSGPDDWEARSEVIHLPDHAGMVKLTINEQIKDIRIEKAAPETGAEKTGG